ncbi:hypothetical protein [Cupriavidus taiwanensis]|uniref:hypothetical protein n=1 Tax=Cupriavidus taiwanensis TaxID=164546 RepID=UPI000E103FAB|nr:hypothetical protein [Cupriavidus taiwanensis]SOZ12060.1 conserved protein of unknown function [Cupriavidus taiwanensis]
MATAKKAVPMCVVSIGYQDFLMPVSSGMKLVDLMSTAVGCETRGYPTEVTIRDQPEIRMEMVKAKQIRAPGPDRSDSDSRTLEHRPSPVLRLR